MDKNTDTVICIYTHTLMQIHTLVVVVCKYTHSHHQSAIWSNSCKTQAAVYTAAAPLRITFSDLFTLICTLDM